GARLARDLYAGDAGLLPRAAVVHHDVAHGGVELRQGGRLQVGLTQDLRRGLRPVGAVGRVDPLHVAWTIAGAAIRDRRDEVRHLERGRRHVSLADGDRERFAGEPRLVEATALPLRVGDGPGLLVLETDTGRQPEPETAGVLGDRVHAQPLTHRVEEHVARLHDRRVEAHRPMSTLPPAPE